MYFNVAAEEVLVVIGPEPTSITDAYALIKVLSTQHGVREFSVVVNRAPIGSDGRAVFAQLSTVTSRFLQVSLNYRGPIAEDSSVVEAVVKQMLRHNGRQAPRECDQAAGIAAERLVVGARFIIKPFQVRIGHQLE